MGFLNCFHITKVHILPRLYWHYPLFLWSMALNLCHYLFVWKSSMHLNVLTYLHENLVCILIYVLTYLYEIHIMPLNLCPYIFILLVWFHIHWKHKFLFCVKWLKCKVKLNIILSYHMWSFVSPLIHSYLIFMLQPKVKLLIGGEFIDSQAKEWIDVINPVSWKNLIDYRYTYPFALPKT